MRLRIAALLTNLFMSALLVAQVPDVDVSVPSEAFVGESFCFEVDFTNSGEPGYGPYMLVSLPPELSFDSATLNSLGTSATLVDVFPPSGELEDPISGETVAGESGGSLFLIVPPIGSVVEGGQAIVVEICSTIDVDAMVGMPLEIEVIPGFEFGDTPTGDNGPILGDGSTDTVTPTLVVFRKGSSALETERSPGPSWPIEYELIADIADQQTLFNLEFSDLLPASLQYVAGSISVTGGVNCSTTSEPDGSPGGTVSVFCDSGSGTTGDTDVVVSFEAYIVDLLDETGCGTALVNNAATFDADAEKPRGSGNLTPLAQQDDEVGLSAEHVVVQKSAAPTEVLPGESVTYTVEFQVSDFGSASTLLFRDTLPDALAFEGHVSLTVDGVSLAITPTAVVQGDGTTIVDYDLGSVGAPFAGGTAITLVYTGQLQQSYVGGGAVLANDLVTNRGTVLFDLEAGASGCSNETAAPVRVAPIELSKTVVEPQSEYEPGDVVTFRLEMPIPSGDTSQIVFTDFLPLPVFDANLVSTVFGVDVRHAPSDTLGLTPTSITPDAATNSVSILWPDVVTTGPQTLAVDLDVVVLDQPFADDLSLANFFEAQTENSDGEVQASTAPVLINIGSPELQLTKGVSDSSNDASTIEPAATELPVDGDMNNADAGDEVTYVLTVENVGGAPAYEATATDSGAAGLEACAVDSVTDGSGTPLSFSGDLFGAGLRLTEPLAQNDENPAGGGAPFSSDTALITVSCTLGATVEPGEVIVNSASATFTSQPDATPHPAVTDDAMVTMSTPTIDKSLTEILPGYTGSRRTAHVGEILTYEVVVTLGEGVHSGAKLVDLLDTGLAFVDPASEPISITASAGVSTDVIGGFPQVAAGATVSNQGNRSVQLDRRIELDFGNLTVNPTSAAGSETLTIVYAVRVLNWNSNTRGEQRNNRADWQWESPSGGTASVRKRAANATLVEATLQLVKDISPATGDAGDTVTVTLTLGHASGSNATAFDVSLVDALPAGLTAVGSASVANCTQAPTTGPTLVANTLEAGWTLFPVGATCDVVFDATLDVDVVSGSTIENCGQTQWESLAVADQPLAQPPSNPLGAERTGHPSDPGGAANLYLLEACDTVKVTDVTVNKSVVATSEDSTNDQQGDASVVDLTLGEVVTFEFVATLPEGTTQPLIVTDSLPFSPGVLALVANSSTVTNVGSSITIPAGFPTVVESDESLGDGYLDSAVFTFSTTVSDGVVVTDCTVVADCEITMQVQAIVVDIAANADGDQLTNSVLTQYGEGLTGSDTIDVDVVEPMLSIEKKGDKTLAAGEDVVEYTLTIAHEAGSTADAFNVEIEDDLNAVGLNFVQFVGSGLGACTEAPDTGFPTHAGGVVRVEWQSFPLGASCEVVFEASLDVTVVPGNTVTNSADVTWTSIEDPNDETRSYDARDDWGVVVSLPGVIKTITETSLAETEDGEKGSGVVDLTIGEEVTYQMTVSFQNGTTLQAAFSDQLPSSNVVLRMVSSQIVSIGGDLTVPNAAATDPGDDCLATSCDSNGDGERDLAVWDLGDVVNVNGLNGVADDVVFEVVAVVVDSVNNQGDPGTDQNELNTGTLNFVNDEGVQSLFDTEPIDIVEPGLEIAKNALCIDENVNEVCEADEPQGDPLVVNGGDTLIYEVSLGHVPNSNAHAYAVQVEDTLPTNVTFVGAGSVVPVRGPAPDSVVESPVGLVTFSWDDPMPPGATYTFQYQVTVDVGVTGGEQLKNSVTGSWDSTDDPANTENQAGADSDDETVIVESPTFIKEVVDTSLADTDAGIHDPGLPDVTIGESVTYQLTAIIPAGVSGTALRLVDTVPNPQMELTGARIVSVDAGLLPTSLPGTPVVSDSEPDGLDDTAVFDFGDVSNTGTTVAQIIVEVTAVVLDDPANVGTPNQQPAPTVLTNTGRLEVNGGEVVDTADVEVVEPDLSLVKTMGPIVDGFVTITIDVTNDGTAPVFDAAVTDEFDETIWVPLSAVITNLPSGFESSQDSVAGTTTVTIDLIGAPLQPSADQIIEPGETATFKFQMQLQGGGTPPVTDDIENTATVEGSTLPGDDENERSVVAEGSTTLDLPSLEVTKGAVPNPDPAVPGGTIRYTVTVSNVGDAVATNVAVTDTPDPEGDFQEGTVVVTPAGTVLIGNSASDSSISVLIPSIDPGASATVEYDVQVPNPIPAGLEQLVNQAVADSDELPPVDSDDLSDPTAGDDPTIVPLLAAPDLSIKKSDDGVSTSPGATVVYTLSYSNVGNQAATNIVLTETVPANTTFDQAGSAPSVWSCADGSGPGVTCTITLPGPLAGGGAGGSETFAVTVDESLPAGVEEVANTVTVSDDGTNGEDPNPSNNEGADATPIDAKPDLTLEKSDSGVSVVPGDVIAYQLNYANVGDQDATGVLVSESVPENTTFDAASSSPTWSCGDGSPAGTVCTFSLGSLAVDGNGSVIFAVRVNVPYPLDAPEVENSASIADDGGNGADATPGNNDADESTPVEINSDFVVTKTDQLLEDVDLSTDVSPGDRLRYTVELTNTGDTDLSGVQFDDAPDTNTTLVVGSVTTSLGTVTSGNSGGDSLVSVVAGDVAYATTVTMTFDVIVNDPVVPPPGEEVIYSAALQNPTKLYEIDLQTFDTRFLRDFAFDGRAHAITTCTTPDFLWAIGKDSADLAQIDLTTSPPTETVLGSLGGTFINAVVQMGCGLDNQTLYFTDALTDELWSVDPATCPACLPVFLGRVETALGAADVELNGADIVFSRSGRLYALTNKGPFDKALYRVNPGNALATLIGPVTMPEFNQGLTATSDGRLIAISNDDHLYEIDPLTAAVTDLGIPTEAGMPVVLGFGDAAGAVPARVKKVSNQGSASSDQVTSVLTDDPEAAGVADPTCTVLGTQPLLDVWKSVELLDDVDGSGDVSANDVLLYTLTVSNLGTSEDPTAFVRDVPGAGSALVVGSVSTSFGTVSSGNASGDVVVEVTLGALAAGASETVLFEVTVDGTEDRIENQAIVTGASEPIGILSDDPGTAGIDDATVTVLGGVALLDAVKTDQLVIDADGDGVAGPGDTLRYTLSVSNLGASDATGVELDDTPDSSTELVVGSVATSSGTVLLGNTGGDTAVSVDIGTVEAGASESVVFDVTVVAVPLTPTLNNQAQVVADGGLLVVTDDAASDEADDATETVLASPPDLAVTKDDGGVLPLPGDTLVYDLTYINVGQADATGVVMTETVPADSVFDAASSSGLWTCSDGDPAGTVCTLLIGSVASGASGSESFGVRIDNPLPPGVDTVSNTVSIEDDGSHGVDANSGDNSDTARTRVLVEADLLVQKVDVYEPAMAGEVQTYEFTVTNEGPNVATAVTLTDILPAEVTFIATSLGEPACSEAAGTVTCDMGSLAAGESSEVAISVLVDHLVSGTVSNQATVAATEEDPVPSNNEAVAETRIDARMVVKALADIDGNGVDEIAVMHQANSPVIDILDSLSGLLLQSIPLEAGYLPVDLEVMDSFAGSSAPEVAALVVRPSDGAVRVHVYDALEGRQLASRGFPSRLVPCDLEVVPDIDGSGVDELGVLGREPGTGANEITIKDPLSTTTLGMRGMSSSFFPLDFEVLDHFAGGAADEIAIVGKRARDGNVTVVVRDSATGAQVSFWDNFSEWVPLELEVVASFGDSAAAELAVLARDPFSGKQRVFLTDAGSGMAFTAVNVDRDFVARDFEVLDDFEGSSSQELAVLATQPTSGLIRVFVRDAGSGATLSSVPFGKADSPHDLEVVEDTGMDTPAQEVSVLAITPSALSVTVRDADSTTKLSVIPIP